MSAELDELFAAFEQLFIAQRRLRGRDSFVVEGISLAEFRALRMLTRLGPVPVGKLADRLGVTPAATTQMLDRLETRDLVARVRSAEDRRVFTVELTDAGRARGEASRRQHREVFDASLDDLSAEELQAGLEVMRRCVGYLDELSQPS